MVQTFSQTFVSMTSTKDAEYFTNKYPDNYVEHGGGLGCCWCMNLIPFEQAESHLKDPDHILNRKKGFTQNYLFE